MDPVQKAMELSAKYSSCLETKLFGIIPNEQERELCKAAAKLCNYDKGQFYGALQYLLSR